MLSSICLLCQSLIDISKINENCNNSSTIKTLNQLFNLPDDCDQTEKINKKLEKNTNQYYSCSNCFIYLKESQNLLEDMLKIHLKLEVLKGKIKDLIVIKNGENFEKNNYLQSILNCVQIENKIKIEEEEELNKEEDSHDSNINELSDEEETDFEDEIENEEELAHNIKEKDNAGQDKLVQSEINLKVQTQNKRRRRGRPRKIKVIPDNPILPQKAQNIIIENEIQDTKLKPKFRGRLKKIKTENSDILLKNIILDEEIEEKNVEKFRVRGRPKRLKVSKITLSELENEDEIDKISPNTNKKRGRPKKIKSEEAVVAPINPEDNIKKRGRKSKNAGEKKKYKKAPMKCDKCDLILRGRLKYTTHNYKVHGIKSFKCEEEGCNAEFGLEIFLQNHIKNIHSNIIHKCPVENCDKNYKTLYLYKLHVKSHDPNSQVICDHCGKLFSDEFKLKKHKIIVHTDKMYNCEKCTFKTSMNSKLRQHQKIHDENRNRNRIKLICHICGKEFSTLHTLNGHSKIHSKNEYKCEENGCDKIFSTPEYLRKHKKRLHKPKSEWKYTCRHCGKKFHQNYKFEAHETLHGGEKKYKCEICGSAKTHPFYVYVHKQFAHKNIK